MVSLILKTYEAITFIIGAIISKIHQLIVFKVSELGKKVWK